MYVEAYTQMCEDLLYLHYYVTFHGVFIPLMKLGFRFCQLWQYNLLSKYRTFIATNPTIIIKTLNLINNN